MYVLATGKASEIEKIFKVLNENGIGKETIENCLYVLATGKASEIEKIFKVLNENGIGKETIENCLYVLARGKASEIEKIFKVLNENGIEKETIEKCLYVLATGKASEIEKIFKVLNENGIGKETVENCLSVLARGKASEIEKICKVLNENGIGKETIEKCLYVLATGKASEIEKIFKVLNENGIGKETIEKCLYVLARGKANEIERILDVLNENGIKKATIEQYFGYIFLSDKDMINDIFAEGSQNIKRFLQLKGYYDRIISEEEIDGICKEKKITKDEFLISLKEEYAELYKETLKRKNGIYIGKPIPIEKAYLEENGKELIEMARNVARNFGYRYGIKDISELESQAVEIMMTKCGDIVYNFSYNEEIIRRFISAKVYNYLKRNLISNELIEDIEGRVGKAQIADLKAQEEVETVGDELNLRDWKLEEGQEEILRYISMYIEQGETLQEAIIKISEDLDIDIEEILGEIEKVKESNKEKAEERGE